MTNGLARTASTKLALNKGGRGTHAPGRLLGGGGGGGGGISNGGGEVFVYPPISHRQVSYELVFASQKYDGHGYRGQGLGDERHHRIHRHIDRVSTFQSVWCEGGGAEGSTLALDVVGGVGDRAAGSRMHELPLQRIDVVTLVLRCQRQHGREPTCHEDPRVDVRLRWLAQHVEAHNTGRVECAIADRIAERGEVVESRKNTMLAEITMRTLMVPTLYDSCL
eukprot:CAMPEP_0205913776 /NCGR_PEP_ID=MMETSP1325-20131115/6766_1 /ASSEMBLY_ACC=CAM_ASM_000708 /TAXON_ID=236786 /ORGANISM="Florenciella sp., Strain RCC1007" /LENGTH=221 /DNA_ID=CAMNT_0053280709 /DNA_START=606 /DNA_END=1271 /DNA_ORIENTATION=+